jgi:hypothetical protein
VNNCAVDVALANWSVVVACDVDQVYSSSGNFSVSVHNSVRTTSLAHFLILILMKVNVDWIYLKDRCSGGSYSLVHTLRMPGMGWLSSSPVPLQRWVRTLNPNSLVRAITVVALSSTVNMGG